MGSLENPAQAGAEGARRTGCLESSLYVETLKQKDRAEHQFRLISRLLVKWFAIFAAIFAHPFPDSQLKSFSSAVSKHRVRPKAYQANG